jgi:hypothetical protein
MKDYRMVCPNTGRISQKLLECDFLGHLVGSVDLGDPGDGASFARRYGSRREETGK